MQERKLCVGNIHAKVREQVAALGERAIQVAVVQLITPQRVMTASALQDSIGIRPSAKEMVAMTLHDRETIRAQFDDCVFADRELTRPVAKYRFPQEGTLPRDAFQLVSDELMLDGNARQNLATFCQTWEEPEVSCADGAVGQQEHDRQGRVPADAPR